MGILHAIGLGIGIIVLRVLVPEIWNVLEHVILSTLTFAGVLVDQLQATTGAIHFPPSTF